MRIPLFVTSLENSLHFYPNVPLFEPYRTSYIENSQNLQVWYKVGFFIVSFFYCIRLVKSHDHEDTSVYDK